jgi:hypothetical protein
VTGSLTRDVSDTHLRKDVTDALKREVTDSEKRDVTDTLRKDTAAYLLSAVEQISYASRYTRSRKQRSFCATAK